MNAIKLFSVTAVIVLASTTIHAAGYLKLGDIKGEAAPIPTMPPSVVAPQKAIPALLLPAVQAAQPGSQPGAPTQPRVKVINGF